MQGLEYIAVYSEGYVRDTFWRESPVLTHHHHLTPVVGLPLTFHLLGQLPLNATKHLDKS